METFSNFLAAISYKRIAKWDMMRNTGWFIDLTCSSNRNYLKYIPESMFGVGFFWLFKGELDDVFTNIKQLNLGISTDLVLMQNNGTYYDIYKLAGNSNLKVISFDFGHFPLKRSRYNLEQIILRGAFVSRWLIPDNQTLDLIRDKYYKPQNEIINRRFYVLFTYLSILYNFTLDVLVTDTFGYKSANGTFNGQIRDVILKNADFGMSAQGITKERLSAVDFTANIDNVDFLLVFLEEKAFGGSKALVQPFSSNVWIGLFVIILMSITVMSIYQHTRKSHSFVSVSCMHIISIISSQGLLRDWPGHNTKFLSTILLLFGMTLTLFYNTSIMNGLLSPIPISIKTVEDLVTHKRIAVANISILSPIFFHPMVIKQLQETHQPVYNIDNGIHKMQMDKTFSLIGDENNMHDAMVRFFTNSEKCDKREIRMSSIHTSNPITKNSHYREMIIQGQYILIERGISHREKKYWYTDTPKCLLSNYFFPVRVESIFVGLCIYLIGLISSLISLFAEIFKNKYL